jgi:hypothetical protein
VTDERQYSPVSRSVDQISALDDAGLRPIKAGGWKWTSLLTNAVTLLMVAALAKALLESGLSGLSAGTPGELNFYIFFALSYISLPFFDFVIFRKLWKIPFSGFSVMLKKRISNEVLFGYSGDAYFYAWASRNITSAKSAFAATKDVAILSSIAGNAITAISAVVAMNLQSKVISADLNRYLVYSLLFLFFTTIPFIVLRKKVFSVPSVDRFWIFGVHVLRTVSTSLFCALAWHSAMPAETIDTWLILVMARLLVSRLPLLPNKDLVFATFAVLLMGSDQTLPRLMAFSAALTLLTHAAVMAILTLNSIVKRRAAAQVQAAPQAIADNGQ